MTTTFSHRYNVHLSQRGSETVISDGEKPVLVGGPPPQFGGQPRWWSPEHLLVSAVGLCFTATFRAFAAKSDLAPRAYSADVEGVLEKTAAGLVFGSFSIRIELDVAPGQMNLATGLLERAKKYCIVANSLKAPVTVTASVKETTGFEAAATTH